MSADLIRTQRPERARPSYGAEQAVTPMIAAKVVYLSADFVETQQVSIDKAAAGMEKRGDSYIVRIKLEEEDVRKRIQGFPACTPGMPADVYIKTGERSSWNISCVP